MKYVVVRDVLSSGYMDCIAICDSMAEAFGQAYITLCGGIKSDDYYVSVYVQMEGESGYVMHLVDKKSGSIEDMAAVLFFDEGGEE